MNTLARAEALKHQANRLSKRLDRVKARVETLQNARLLSGSAFFIALVVAAMRPRWGVALPAAAVFAPVFIWLVVLTRQWSSYSLKLSRLREFVLRQEARCSGHAPVAPMNFAHEKAGSDLDYFGEYSLWTLLDETLTDEGSELLKSWIVSPSLVASEIIARQETVRSLRADRWFFTRLTLIADRSEMRHSSRSVLEFLKSTIVRPSYNLTYVLLLIVWVAWLTMVSLGVQGASIAYFVFLALHYQLIGRSGEAFMKGVGVSNHLGQLFPIFSALEKRTGSSVALRALAPVTSVTSPSSEARPLNFAVAFLSTTANPIIHLMINSIVPWSSTGLFLLERARRRLSSSFENCLRELEHLEALFSLVIFDRYQTSVYPTMTASKLAFQGLLHPLVPRDRVVANSFGFEGSQCLGLLTGSNMSGKSTFLRTVGLNQTLANMGAPVFASSFATRPLAIETCIEVSDSLRDGFSYFYAEVRRLKAVLDSAASRPVLFLIDEIFRGTNNRERQVGSRAVIQTLAASSVSEGFVSTHDLELTALEGPAVVNLHFREEISPAGEMSFTYRLQMGASPTTNALRIMQLEGLPVPSTA